MGHKFKSWKAMSTSIPKDYAHLRDVLYQNRKFSAVDSLEYGDHGLLQALEVIHSAIVNNKKIALYADYDVDGTMSCVSWIWFLKAIGFHNFIYYIPDRFKEGYGVNLAAIKHLVLEKQAQLVITMDTGITANEEAKWCKEQGVDFICTDHHKIQIDKMPDCVILNPKMHPNPDYQELCGCGITFVLLRKLGKIFSPPPSLWIDLLALTGMATICDVVPLGGVNHKLAQQGVAALLKSERPVLKRLLAAAAVTSGAVVDEKDIGFRLGPRINAVGRLDHADKIVEAFVSENPDSLIKYMTVCNEKRKTIQASIVEEAEILAREHSSSGLSSSILFLGSETWHQGVVGIAASKIAERFWRPTWLFHRQGDIGKGSARSIPGFDVTDAMTYAKDLFSKFGGHSAAGGFTFPLQNEDAIRQRLNEFAEIKRQENPSIWESTVFYDCTLPPELTHLELTDHLTSLKPFGHGFREPVFRIHSRIAEVKFYHDKKTGQARHTAVHIEGPWSKVYKVMFFNEVHKELTEVDRASFLVSVTKDQWQGESKLSLMGCDFEI